MLPAFKKKKNVFFSHLGKKSPLLKKKEGKRKKGKSLWGWHFGSQVTKIREESRTTAHVPESSTWPWSSSQGCLQSHSFPSWPWLSHPKQLLRSALSTSSPRLPRSGNSFRKVTERNSSGQQLHICVGQLVWKKKRKKEKKKKKKGREGGKNKREREKKRKGSGSTVFKSTCTLRTELNHLLQETELCWLKPGLAGRGRTSPASDRTGQWPRAGSGSPRLTCGLCVLGPPSVSAPPEQLLPGPNPTKMESSSGHLLFCLQTLKTLFFLELVPD